MEAKVTKANEVKEVSNVGSEACKSDTICEGSDKCLEKTTDTLLKKKAALRKFALMVLDDENGIREDAYIELIPLLLDSGNDDIFEQVEIVTSKALTGRAFICESFAETELGKLKVDASILLPKPTPPPNQIIKESDGG